MSNPNGDGAPIEPSVEAQPSNQQGAASAVGDEVAKLRKEMEEIRSRYETDIRNIKSGKDRETAAERQARLQLEARLAQLQEEREQEALRQLEADKGPEAVQLAKLQYELHKRTANERAWYEEALRSKSDAERYKLAHEYGLSKEEIEAAQSLEDLKALGLSRSEKRKYESEMKKMREEMEAIKRQMSGGSVTDEPAMPRDAGAAPAPRRTTDAEDLDKAIQLYNEGKIPASKLSELMDKVSASVPRA